MIFAQSTPNHAGIAIYGDFSDFENLYDGLHDVVGEEGERVNFDSVRIRVLAICYDLRHALMGNRDYEFVDNGLDQGKKLNMEIVAPDKNVYLKIEALWPEMLFVMIALNDFLELYAKERQKSTYSHNLFAEPKVSWNRTIAHVRMLQSAVSECLKETITDAAYVRLLNVMNGRYVSTERYLTQYIDVLNEKFIHMGHENRLKNISIFGKRISERGREYRELELELKEEARKRNCHVDSLRLVVDYPDEIDW